MHSRAYDGNVSDVVMDRDSMDFIHRHVDLKDRLLIADCRMATDNTIEKMLDVDTHPMTKVPTNFSKKIRDDMVRSAMLGAMDESTEHNGRLYYDTDSDTILGKGIVRNLRFVAFSLPGGYERAERFIRGRGPKSFTKRMSSLGESHCEKDAMEAFEKAMRSSYGAYAADPNIYPDKRLMKKDPNGPCWRVKAKNMRIEEPNVPDASRAYAINVLITTFRARIRTTSGRVRPPDRVIDTYLGQYRSEFVFKPIESHQNVGKVYIHSPARQDAMIFLTSVTAMIHMLIDNVPSPDLDLLPDDPYEDTDTEAKCPTMEHIVDFMLNTTVRYYRDRDVFRTSGARGRRRRRGT